MRVNVWPLWKRASFEKEVEKGIAQKYPSMSAPVQERINEELDWIRQQDMK